jgi:hypothetical protein
MCDRVVHMRSIVYADSTLVDIKVEVIGVTM